MADKQYEVERTPEGVVCIVKTKGRQPYLLKNIGVHSIDGFEMGYAGSGPADLALTILCDHLDVEKAGRKMFMKSQLQGGAWDAWRFHQDFKLKFITPHNDYTGIPAKVIDKWLKGEDRLRTGTG